METLTHLLSTEIRLSSPKLLTKGLLLRNCEIRRNVLLFDVDEVGVAAPRRCCDVNSQFTDCGMCVHDGILMFIDIKGKD